MPVVAPPAPRQFVGIMRRNKPRKDRLLAMALRDLDDDRQSALHPWRVPGRVLGKQILHVDAEMGGPPAERPEAKRARLRHTRLTNAGRPRVPELFPSPMRERGLTARMQQKTPLPRGRG